MNSDGFDGLPPMQTIPGEALYDMVTEDLPRYRFATAGLNSENEVEIVESVPTLSPNPTPPNDGEVYTDNVIQTYSVQIPYTEVVDGNSITRFRSEHRTRTVPIQRVRPKAGAENKWQERTYTVSVPYTEQIEGGGVIRRNRLETRTRICHVDEPPRNFEPKKVAAAWSIEDLECYSPTGDRLSNAEANARLKIPVPVVLISHADFIVGSYFANLLRPESCIIVDPTDYKFVQD